MRNDSAKRGASSTPHPPIRPVPASRRFALRTAATLGLVAAFGIARASGLFTYTPEFFATPADDRALVTGTDFSIKGGFARTLLYLHLSGRFTDAHGELFERYLDRPTRARSRGNPALEWRRLAESAGGGSASINTRRYVSVQSSRNGAPITTSRYIENCQDDAFVTALATFNERRQRYGQDSAPFQRWVAAQQRVFSNCSGRNGTIPAPPDDTWSDLEKQDRAYQIAASHFYNLEYQRAAGLFRAIANDTASPWADISRYLVARCLVRDAEVNGNDVETNLRAALALYRDMAADPDYLERFPSVGGLVRYLEIELDTPGFMRRSAEAILERPAEVDAGTLDDFLYLIDHGGLDSTLDVDGEPELLRWHRLTGNASAAAARAILGRWQSTRNPAWLDAALARPLPDNDASLLETYGADLDGLDPATPGYADMLVALAKLLDDTGNAAQARKLASTSLSRSGLDLAPKHLNRLQYLVAKTGGDPIEYLRLAQLPPVAMRLATRIGYFEPEALRAATRGSTLFPDATVQLINNAYTPGMLLDAVDAIGFNEYLEGRLVIAAWVKALLLDDASSAHRAAEHLEPLFPELQTELDQYLAGADSDFVAARIILTHPGFSPWIPPGIGRYRDGAPGGGPVFVSATVALPQRSYNWWCDETRTTGPVGRETSVQRLDEQPFFRDLPPGQLEQMSQMPARLERSAPEFFGPAVLEYARAEPDDPRVPYALHRLVFATHFSCVSGPGEISRAAFELLHENYPDSEWTEATPFWFK